MYTPLLVKLSIVDTSYMAGGHRCSLRHNVCRPATARMRIYTIVKFYLRGKYLYVAFLDIYFMYTPMVVCCYNNESQIWRYNTYNCITNTKK